MLNMLTDYELFVYIYIFCILEEFRCNLFTPPPPPPPPPALIPTRSTNPVITRGYTER